MVKNMKLIKGIFSGLLLIFMMTVLVGCNKLGVIQEYKYDDSNYIAGNKAFSSVMNKINIDWIVGNIFITQSNNHEVIIREETDIDIEEKYKMHYYFDGDTLNVKFCGSMTLIDYTYKTKNLYVFLPSEINEIEINDVSADINVNLVSIVELDIDNVSGDITIEDSTLKYLEIDNTSGEIMIFKDTFNMCDISTVSGNMGLSFVALPKDMSIESVSADITLYINDKESMAIEFETVSGKVKSNLEYKKEKDIYIFNSKDKVFEVETVSGDLIVNKK